MSYGVKFTLDKANASFPLLFLGSDPLISSKKALEKLDRDQVMKGTAEYWRKARIGTGPRQLYVRYLQLVDLAEIERCWSTMA